MHSTSCATSIGAVRAHASQPTADRELTGRGLQGDRSRRRSQAWKMTPLALAPASMCYMTTTKPDKPVPVRIPPEMVARIDRLRGLVPRETYVRDLLDKALKTQERKPEKR